MDTGEPRLRTESATAPECLWAVSTRTQLASGCNSVDSDNLRAPSNSAPQSTAQTSPEPPHTPCACGRALKLSSYLSYKQAGADAVTHSFSCSEPV